jgi:putative ABC transport system permease protein
VTSLFGTFRQDVRHAVRLWRSTPGLTIAVLTSLTFSIGAATAVFTCVDALLLRPLPVGAPEQLHAVGPAAAANLDLSPPYFSPSLYNFLTESDPAFRDLFASSVVLSSGVHMSADGSAERLRAELVSGNYFRVLGIAARIGRTISEGDDRAIGAHPVVVLSDVAWRQRFNRRADIVGQTVRLNGFPYTVIGVTGEGFYGTRPGFTPDLWVPLSMTSQVAGDLNPSPSSNYIELTLRVAPSTSRAVLEHALTSAYQQWIATTEVPSTSAARREQPTLRLTPAGRGLSRLRGEYGQPLLILLSVVALLLIIACANVANLLLARGLARRREMAIRLSQGATAMRLTRQLVTEGLVLTVAGGALGWFAALIMGRGLIAFLPASAATWPITADARAFLVTAGIVTLAGLAFGVLPSRTAARLDLNQALRKDTVDGRLALTFVDGQMLLSALQVALSLVLVIASVLFARTLYNLRSGDTGFQHERVVLAALDPVKSGYSPQRTQSFYDELLTRLRAQPSVRAAGLASYGSLSGVMAAGTRFLNTPMHASGQVLPPAVDATVYINDVSAGYFDAVGMLVHRGRDFTRQDTSTSAKVAIVNETAARYFFGDTDPVGQRIGPGRAGPAEIEIIGVVSDAKYLNLREDARRTVYRPHAQAFHSLMTVHVSTAADQAALGPVIEREVRTLDPSLPVFNVQTMRGRMDESLQQERLVSTLAGALSMLGALLAAVGVYSVVNYAVVRRSRELAIRIAVGASPRHVASVVLKRSLQIALSGLALGVPLALISTALYRTFLFGVTASDPWVVSVSAVGVVLVTVAAGYIPARRAGRIDPLLAMREE